MTSREHTRYTEAQRCSRPYATAVHTKHHQRHFSHNFSMWLFVVVQARTICRGCDVPKKQYAGVTINNVLWGKTIIIGVDGCAPLNGVSAYMAVWCASEQHRRVVSMSPAKWSKFCNDAYFLPRHKAPASLYSLIIFDSLMPEAIIHHFCQLSISFTVFSPINSTFRSHSQSMPFNQQYNLVSRRWATPHRMTVAIYCVQNNTRVSRVIVDGCGKF